MKGVQRHFSEDDSALTRFEEGPTHVPVHEAIAWARQRSDEVYVQVGDVLYTAGATKAAELPQWQEQTSISARTEVAAHEPWLDRTELDDPIDWDVVIAPSESPRLS